MTSVNSIFSRKKTPANIAKKRLQNILFEHKIKNNFEPHYMPQLKQDILQTIQRYIHNPNILSIQLETQDQNKYILKWKIIFFNERNNK